MFNKKMHPDHYNYEYFILKNITHPNIVKCCGYSEDYNHFYMELEYCITGDLSKCLWQNKSSHVYILLNNLVSIPRKLLNIYQHKFY